MPRKLTAKQERFLQTYLTNGRNGVAAYRAAYDASAMSPHAIHTEVNRLLKNPAIALRIGSLEVKQEKALERIANQYEVTAERIIGELARLGFSNMMDYIQLTPDGNAVMDWSNLTRDQAAAIVEVTVDEVLDKSEDGPRRVRRVKFKLSDKRQALVDLGKHLGMFIDRKQVEVRTSADQMERQKKIRDELYEMVERVRSQRAIDVTPLPVEPQGPPAKLANGSGR